MSQNGELGAGAVAARLIVEGALPAIAGGPAFAPESMITPGRLVTGEERANLGLERPGRTYLFAALGSGVFLDLSGPNASAWFIGGDFDSAVDVFDSVLRLAYPHARQTDDRALPDSQRARAYRIDFGNGRRAFVELLYALPEATGELRTFTARATALQETGQPAAAGPAKSQAAPAAPKKKGWF
ncbi:MAG: hypothetical protein AB7J28_08750 [Hyphomonadaceae bacterium]